MSFAGWFMNRWLTVPGAPALHVLGHEGDDAGAIKRAMKATEYVVSLWREEWWKTAESVTDALAHTKSVSGKSSDLDDCDLDAAKPLRALIWKVVRTQFAAKVPVQMQKFLGVVREAWAGTSSCRGLCLT